MGERGHNSGVTPETYLRHNSAIQAKVAAMESLKGELRNAIKRAKDDGLDEADRKFVLKLSKLDPMEQVEKMNRIISYAKFMRLFAGEAMSTIDPFDVQRPKTMEDHKSEGFQASSVGKSRSDCQHDPNSDAGRAWLEGYEESQAILREGFKDLKAAANDDTPPDEDAPPPPKTGRGKGKKAKASDIDPPPGHADEEPPAPPGRFN